jgi:hypothetical protein
VAVSYWRPVWLLLSFGLAVATNHFMRPRVSYAATEGERTMPTGSLWLEDGGPRRQLQLTTLHAVFADVRRPFAAPLTVRELWIRSPEQAGQGGPDLELFVDFGAVVADPAGPAEIVKQKLPLLQAAIGSTARSRIRFAGAEKPSMIREGQLLIREILPTEAAAMWRIDGELELVVVDGGTTRTLHGKLNARLAWQ